jgi:alpha,alpha-trehalase
MPNDDDFRPLRRIDGYLPIEDHGLIGDGETAALVARNGSIPWLCLPRFDSPALFGGILDAERGGGLLVAPEGSVESRQAYVPDTGVLVTDLRTEGGHLRLTDALTIRSGADLGEGLPVGRGELLRTGEVLRGPVRVRIRIRPRGGGEVQERGDGFRISCVGRRDLSLQLFTSLPLDGLDTLVELDAGDRFHLLLTRGSDGRQPQRRAAGEPEAVLTETVEAWRRWSALIRYEGPQETMVRRSAITLKLLDHFASGGIVAAPTSSLPEAIGGPRNWDYRYAWIRDAAFSVYALRRIGAVEEAWGFLEWVLDAVDRRGRPRVLYSLDGEDPEPEWEDPELEGYRGSQPVRWGNAAADQRQHDVYGEILDCAYQWAAHGGGLDEHLWEHLERLVEAAAEEWQNPDHGIWEVRTEGRPFTYSAAMCQVALDRGARLAERFGLHADVDGWRAQAAKITEAILEEAWDPEVGSLTEHLGGGGLDASLLSLPLRRVIPATHAKMVATTEAIAERLGAGDGLLYRYLPDESPDGLPGDEGAFLLCSFWLVDNLAKQGRVEEAGELFDSLCGRANPLGLLPEQIDPSSGGFLGNFPQAFSHVGVISSAINLARSGDARG